MEKIRILHLHFGTDGGAERFFVNLAQAVGRRGIEQQFVIRPGRSWKRELQHLGPILENRGRRFSPSGLLLQWTLRRLVQQWKPHMVLAWKPRSAHFIPNVQGPVKLARLGDFPFNLKHFDSCDMLVVNNPAIGERCKQMGWGRPIHVISNFPTPVVIQPVDRASLATPSNAFVIANAGRLVENKGFDLLVKMLPQLPDVHAWLIGDGPEREKLEQMAQDCGVKARCHFTGWVKEPINYLAAANALVMTSRHEPLGNVVLEAWQAGIPVISTRSEGPDWFMTDGQDGLLVDIDDLEDLTKAVHRIQTEPALADRLRNGGFETLRSRFSETAVVDQYLALLKGQTHQAMPR